MSRRLVPFAAAAALLAASGAAAQGTRLLRHPAVNGNAVAFEYGGDLWVTTRAGGPARRLTSTPDVETDPHFSPDGSHIAFSRTSNGNTDVYVVSAAGGEPTRLTFHPGNDRARGWTPDGKRVAWVEGPRDRGSVMVAPLDDLKQSERVSAAANPDQRCHEIEQHRTQHRLAAPDKTKSGHQ